MTTMTMDAQIDPFCLLHPPRFPDDFARMEKTKKKNQKEKTANQNGETICHQLTEGVVAAVGTPSIVVVISSELTLFASPMEKKKKRANDRLFSLPSPSTSSSTAAAPPRPKRLSPPSSPTSSSSKKQQRFQRRRGGRVGNGCRATTALRIAGDGNGGVGCDNDGVGDNGAVGDNDVDGDKDGVGACVVTATGNWV